MLGEGVRGFDLGGIQLAAEFDWELGLVVNVPLRRR